MPKQNKWTIRGLSTDMDIVKEATANAKEQGKTIALYVAEAIVEKNTIAKGKRT